MVDEDKLTELFRNAAPSAPDSSFDRDDVLRGSRRVSARRRVAGSAGALVLAAVAFGGVGVGTGWFLPASDSPSVASDAPTRQVEPSPASPPDAGGGSPGILSQPRAGDGERSGRGQEPTCGPPDAELTGTVRDVLPRVAAAEPVAVADQVCRSGGSATAFPVRTAGDTGEILVLVRPTGQQGSASERQRPDGARHVVRTTEDGRAVVVVSEPDPGSAPPYGGELAGFADRLAQQY